MMPRQALMWLLSGVMLAWVLLMGVYSHRYENCREIGGVWDWRRWHCRSAPAIELRRELQRG